MNKIQEEQMSLPKNFLWEGSLAASGMKGLTVRMERASALRIFCTVEKNAGIPHGKTNTVDGLAAWAFSIIQLTLNRRTTVQNIHHERFKV
jgi:hypothetical protein